MVKTTAQRFRTAPDSELGLLLRVAVATGEPVVVDTGDATFVIGVALDEDGDAAQAPDPMSRRPSPEQVARSLAGIRQAAGAWNDIDAEALNAYIRERRRTANRSPVQI